LVRRGGFNPKRENLLLSPALSSLRMEEREWLRLRRLRRAGSIGVHLWF